MCVWVRVRTYGDVDCHEHLVYPLRSLFMINSTLYRNFFSCIYFSLFFSHNLTLSCCLFSPSLSLRLFAFFTIMAGQEIQVFLFNFKLNFLF